MVLKALKVGGVGLVVVGCILFALIEGATHSYKDFPNPLVRDDYTFEYSGARGDSGPLLEDRVVSVQRTPSGSTKVTVHAYPNCGAVFLTGGYTYDRATRRLTVHYRAIGEQTACGACLAIVRYTIHELPKGPVRTLVKFNGFEHGIFFRTDPRRAETSGGC